jgi:hypothetical protein
MMTDGVKKSQLVIARLVVSLAIGLAIVGVAMYGISENVLQRLWHNLADRPGGPMTFRVVLQPLMASLAALHDGRKDAGMGRSPYFWSIITHSGDRVERLGEGVVATGRVLLLAIVMDVIYQVTVLKTLYPGEVVIVAVVLAFAPYVLLRGPFARLAAWRNARKA